MKHILSGMDETRISKRKRCSENLVLRLRVPSYVHALKILASLPYIMKYEEI
jgi:hypothetical protein